MSDEKSDRSLKFAEAQKIASETIGDPKFWDTDQLRLALAVISLTSELARHEPIDTGLLCRAFGVSVAEAKRATETIGFMYRQRA